MGVDELTVLRNFGYYGVDCSQVFYIQFVVSEFGIINSFADLSLFYVKRNCN